MLTNTYEANSLSSWSRSCEQLFACIWQVICGACRTTAACELILTYFISMLTNTYEANDPIPRIWPLSSPACSAKVGMPTVAAVGATGGAYQTVVPSGGRGSAAVGMMVSCLLPSISSSSLSVRPMATDFSSSCVSSVIRLLSSWSCSCEQVFPCIWQVVCGACRNTSACRLILTYFIPMLTNTYEASNPIPIILMIPG